MTVSKNQLNEREAIASEWETSEHSGGGPGGARVQSAVWKSTHTPCLGSGLWQVLLSLSLALSFIERFLDQICYIDSSCYSWRMIRDTEQKMNYHHTQKCMNLTNTMVSEDTAGTNSMIQFIPGSKPIKLIYSIRIKDSAYTWREGTRTVIGSRSYFQMPVIRSLFFFHEVLITQRN